MSLPTNEQIVAACQRAGIHYVDLIDNYLGLYDNDGSFRYIVASDDTQTGSALFIVAVLGAVPLSALQANKDYLVKRANSGAWAVWSGRFGWQCFDTLTAACMAAIVAAYPEGGE